MTRLFHLNRVRIGIRLLIINVGTLLIGFAALTLVAGQQISSSATADFEQRLLNEIQLIAQGIYPYLNSQTTDTEANTALNELIAGYEAQLGGKLILYGENDPFRTSFHDMPEMETAIRGEVIVVTRPDADGHMTLYTAAPVNLHSGDKDWQGSPDQQSTGQPDSNSAGSVGENNGGQPDQPPRRFAIVQLSVPIDRLQALVWERWVSLWLVFSLVTALALVAAVLLSRSIIQPLYTLRKSAARLATGDFSHRVAYDHPDEIGEVAQAFNEMAHQVQSMLDEQRAFASNTSHELRTPLTTIRLRSEALRYDTGLDAETARRYVDEIDDEVNRLGTLIEDLTLLSRFDAGRAEPGDNQIEPGRFAASLIQRMLPLAEARQIHLELIAATDLQPIRASLNHLTVVFRNLLDNAIKYTQTEDNGSEPKRITWLITASAAGVTHIIKDNGRGIAPDQLPHLFERFYRADKARSRDVPGTGLGLAIVKSIVEAYGGTITITSEGVGKGTTVTVFLPYIARSQEKAVLSESKLL